MPPLSASIDLGLRSRCTSVTVESRGGGRYRRDVRRVSLVVGVARGVIGTVGACGPVSRLSLFSGLLVILVVTCAVQARAELPTGVPEYSEFQAARAGITTPPTSWPLPKAAGELLLAVASGVTLFDDGRATLRATLGPQAARAIGLDHPGYPAPCERAMAAAYREADARAAVAELEALEEKSHAQEVEWATAMIPAGGIRFRGGRVLTGDSAVRWILAHPADFDPDLAHRLTLKARARAALTKLVRTAVADARSAERACRTGR